MVILMDETIFVEIVYITEGGAILKIGKDNVTNIKITNNGICIYFKDGERLWIRFIPFTSILYYETNIMPKL